MKKKKYPQEMIDSMKQQIINHFAHQNTTWEELLEDYIPFDEDELNDVWKKNPLPADVFFLNTDSARMMWLVPFCKLVDGGEVVAIYNLKCIQHIEYHQAEANVYTLEKETEPGYFLFLQEEDKVIELYHCW